MDAIEGRIIIAGSNHGPRWLSAVGGKFFPMPPLADSLVRICVSSYHSTGALLEGPSAASVIRVPGLSCSGLAVGVGVGALTIGGRLSVGTSTQQQHHYGFIENHSHDPLIN